MRLRSGLLTPRRAPCAGVNSPRSLGLAELGSPAPAPRPTPSRHDVAVSLTGPAFLHRGSPPCAPDCGPSRHPPMSLREAGYAGCWWPWGGGTTRGPKMTSLTRASPAQRPSPPREGWSSAGETEGHPRKAAAWPTCVVISAAPPVGRRRRGQAIRSPAGGCVGGLSLAPFLRVREACCSLLLSGFPPRKREADDALAAAGAGAGAALRGATTGEDWVRGHGLSCCYFLQLHMDP